MFRLANVRMSPLTPLSRWIGVGHCCDLRYVHGRFFIFDCSPFLGRNSYNSEQSQSEPRTIRTPNQKHIPKPKWLLILGYLYLRRTMCRLEPGFCPKLYLASPICTHTTSHGSALLRTYKIWSRTIEYETSLTGFRSWAVSVSRQYRSEEKHTRCWASFAMHTFGEVKSRQRYDAEEII